MKNRKFLWTGVILLLLFILALALVFLHLTQSADTSVALWLNANLGFVFTHIMVVVTEYGREYFWGAILILMLLFGDRHTRILAVELAALFVVGIIAGEALKTVLYRERPWETVSSIVARVPLDTDSSFPSGHALMVSIGAIFALTRFRHKWLSILLAIEAGIVSYSRVYVGMHYPMDVIGGVLLGGAVVYLGLFVIDNYFTSLIDRVGQVLDDASRKMHAPNISFVLNLEKNGKPA